MFIQNLEDKIVLKSGCCSTYLEVSKKINMAHKAFLRQLALLQDKREMPW